MIERTEDEHLLQWFDMQEDEDIDEILFKQDDKLIFDFNKFFKLYEGDKRESIKTVVQRFCDKNKLVLIDEPEQKQKKQTRKIKHLPLTFRI